MSNAQRITIKEIAEQAGVSKQTVSRVLNDRPDVSPQTRQRIQAIIDHWGYQPSQLARSLTRGRTSTIGVISSGLQYFGPSQILTGIVEQAHALGYTLSLSLFHESGDLTVTLRDMQAQQVAGVVWAAVSKVGDEQRRILEELANSALATVAAGQPHPGLAVVYADSSTGGQLATGHLIEQGYRTIGLIAGPDGEWSAHQRLLGWQRVLQSSNAPHDESLIVQGDWTAASGARGLQKLLQQRPDADAVFASNDQMALGALSVASNLGRRVPQDLGVVGLDDIPEANYFIPALTTVRQDLRQMGRALVQELDRFIQAQSLDQVYEPQTVVIPPQLIVRASSGVGAPRV